MKRNAGFFVESIEERAARSIAGVRHSARREEYAMMVLGVDALVLGVVGWREGRLVKEIV